MDEGIEQLVLDQMIEVQVRHPNLELIREPSGVLCIKGKVGFTMEYKSRTIEDFYNLEFKIPKDYPDSPPAVYETVKAGCPRTLNTSWLQVTFV